jgi:hypothetical protein
MLEEMVSTGTSKKWLRRALTHGNIPLLRTVSFQNIDRIGKATLMNGSLRKYQKLATKNPAKLKKLWGEAFGDDFDSLVRDLKASAKGSPPSSNVKTVVFADLADVQPVTLLEMPELYLRNPNGRIGYMLRTFQLKYINLLRKTMVEGFTKGNRAHAIGSGVALMSMFTAGGVTSDMLKHAMLNRDPAIDEIVVDNILANTGVLSRYDVEKLSGSRTPVTHIVSTLAPPVGIFDPFAYAFGQVATGGDITKEDKARMMAKLPIAGRILENYGFGGRERFADRQFQESMKIDLEIE